MTDERKYMLTLNDIDALDRLYGYAIDCPRAKPIEVNICFMKLKNVIDNNRLLKELLIKESEKQ